MVNTEDFIKRLEQVLQFYELSASAFADQIGVQRSSISHLLSGRNKPSLDFVLKVCDVFDEVTLPWFLKGEGPFPKNNNNGDDKILQNKLTNNLSEKKSDFNSQNDLFSSDTIPDNAQSTINKEEVSMDTFALSNKESDVYTSPFDRAKSAHQTEANLNVNSKNEVDFVVVFYKDGSCRYFKNV